MPSISQRVRGEEKRGGFSATWRLSGSIEGIYMVRALIGRPLSRLYRAFTKAFDAGSLHPLRNHRQ